MGTATLSVWDYADGQTHEIEISWDQDYDEDAKAKIPGTFRDRWITVTKILQRQGDPVAPYPTLPIEVPLDRLTKSATGLYAIAREIFGPGAGWRVPPPYPEAEDTGEPPPGVVT